MEANHMGAKGKFFTCGLGHMRSNHMGATHSLVGLGTSDHFASDARHFCLTSNQKEGGRGRGVCCLG